MNYWQLDWYDALAREQGQGQAVTWTQQRFSGPSYSPLPDNSRELIDWLESAHGELWSQEKHTKVKHHAILEDHDDLPDGHYPGGIDRPTMKHQGMYRNYCGCREDLPPELEKEMLNNPDQHCWRADIDGVVYLAQITWDGSKWEVSHKFDNRNVKQYGRRGMVDRGVFIPFNEDEVF